MQKLSKRDTYTPTNASQVCKLCDLTLNIPMGKESVEDLKTFDNNSEENLQHSHRAGLNPKVSNIVYASRYEGVNSPSYLQNKKLERRMIVIPPTTKVMDFFAITARESLL